MTYNIDEDIQNANWPKQTWDLPHSLDGLIGHANFRSAGNPVKANRYLKQLSKDPTIPYGLKRQLDRYLKGIELKDRIDSITGGIEVKLVRHVRTPAGQRRYDQPIGTVITSDGPLKNLVTEQAFDPAWRRIGTEGSDQKYDVGQPKGKDWYVYRDGEDKPIHKAKDEEEALKWLDANIAKDAGKHGKPAKEGGKSPVPRPKSREEREQEGEYEQPEEERRKYPERRAARDAAAKERAKKGTLPKIPKDIPKFDLDEKQQKEFGRQRDRLLEATEDFPAEKKSKIKSIVSKVPKNSEQLTLMLFALMETHSKWVGDDPDFAATSFWDTMKDPMAYFNVMHELFAWAAHLLNSGLLTKRAQDIVERKDKVRTAAGAEHYGQPIGSTIHRDVIPSRIARITGEPLAQAAGSSYGMAYYKTKGRQPAPFKGTLPSKELKIAKNPKITPTSWSKGEPPEKPIPGCRHLYGSESDDPDYWEGMTDAMHREYIIGEIDDNEWQVWGIDKKTGEEFHVATGRTKGEALGFTEDFLVTHTSVNQRFWLKPGMHWASDKERKAHVIPPQYRSAQVRTKDTTALKWNAISTVGKEQPKYDDDFRGQQDGKKFNRCDVLEKNYDKIVNPLWKNTGDDVNDALLMVIRIGMRPGGESSGPKVKEEVETFGATDLQSKHITSITPAGQITLHFTPGKKAEPVTIKIRDKRLADMLRERKKKYSHSKQLFPDADADKINDLVKDIAGQFVPDVTARTFRTLKANMMASALVGRHKGPASSKTEFNRWRREVLDEVSQTLGNTPTVCKTSYVNPAVFHAWLGDPSWL